MNKTESPKGFITAPTVDQLKPTLRESWLLEWLWKWQEQSAKSPLVIGRPLKRVLLILPLAMLLAGCAYLRSSTTKAPDGSENTIVRVVTFFDSQSQLTKFRNTTGQIGNGSNVWSYPPGSSIGSYDATSTSTNFNELLGLLMQSAVAGAVKGAK